MLSVFTQANKDNRANQSGRVSAPRESTDSFASNRSSDFLFLSRKTACACGGDCPNCQAKNSNLPVSDPNDASEIEADQIADKVMRMSLGEKEPVASSASPTNFIHRKCDKCEEKDETIHRKPLPSGGSSSFQSPAHVSSALSSGGHPLDAATRAFFEPRLGYDLDSVRIHTGDTAEQSAKAVDAKAYTLGSNIVFGSGEYRPQSESGRHLIAHELAHVAQQSGQSTRIQRKSISDEDEIHDQILDDFSAETGMPRDEVSHHSKEYKAWLADKHAGAEEFKTFKLTATHLKIPQVLRRFERMTLEELYSYRLDYMFSEDGTKDAAVIKYLTDLMIGRPLQKCSKEDVKKTDDIAKQIMKDIPVMINNALNAITRLLRLWVNNKSDLLAKRSKFSGEVSCAFISNFNITETDANFGVIAIRVERRLIQLQKRIAKPISFSCEGINSKICLESKGRDAEGYVVNHKEPIHLCFGFRDNGIYSFQQSTIIHELLHLLPGLGDDGGYAAFSTSALTCKPNIQFSAAPDVLDNTADSITGFVMHIDNKSATDLKVIPF